MLLSTQFKFCYAIKCYLVILPVFFLPENYVEALLPFLLMLLCHFIAYINYMYVTSRELCWDRKSNYMYNINAICKAASNSVSSDKCPVNLAFWLVKA